MSISFYEDKNSVYLVFRKQIKGKKINLKYYPGINPDGQPIVKNRTGVNSIDKKLAEIELAALDVIEKTDVKNINSKIFSDLIEARLKNKDVKNETNFYTYCQRYFDKILEESGYEEAKHYNKAKNKLKKFNPKLTFSDIDLKFYHDFKKWLEKEGYSKNYIGAIIRNMKSILNHATDMGENSKLDYKKFPNVHEEVYNVYLTEKEIEKIYNLEISIDDLKKLHKEIEKETGQKKYHLSEFSYKKQAESLIKAKKLLIIGCWTGLRVGNYLKIDPGLHVKNGFIHAIANKNGPKLKIPMHRMVREIVKNGFPEPMSEQKFNKHIKALGRLAGIDDEIIYSRTIGGKRKEFSKPKYEMITSHTARRSFASNMEVNGVPRQYIMAITGHKSEKSYLKYIQAVSQDILTEKMKDFDVWG